MSNVEVSPEVLELIGQLNASKYTVGKDYKGYKVFIPQYKGNICLGLPLVVLQNENEVRISTPEESIDIINQEDEQGMETEELKEQVIEKV